MPQPNDLSRSLVSFKTARERPRTSGNQFAVDSTLEQAGFELPVPLAPVSL
jgi:hypothetical protein